MSAPDPEMDWREALWFLELLANRSQAPRERIRAYADIVAAALLASDGTEAARIKALAEANEQRQRDAADWYADVRKKLAYFKSAGYAQGEAIGMLADRLGCSRSTIYRAILDDVSRRTACDKPAVKGDEDA